MNKDIQAFILILGIFLLFYFIPLDTPLMGAAVLAGLALLNEYAREHVLTCLVPAFFIAGAIIVFIQKEAVLKYLGGKTKKYISYSLASTSGAVLAVCSCTILPLFAGIRKRGAGLGPAITFLFSGPAINIAAIFLTMSVLGFEIGLARIIAAILIAILVGLSMQFIFREKIEEGALFVGEDGAKNYRSGLVILFMLSMAGVLVVNGLAINFTLKYLLMLLLALITVGIATLSFHKKTNKEWLQETWKFSKLLIPLLFIGVFVAGFIMPFLPETLIVNMVGSNSILGNVLASVFGAFMYFSTLTEVPITQALITKGMHQGPALALLLAGPSLSLPNLLVIRKVLGNKKTTVYMLLVIIYSTIAGLIFGLII
jgi:uncharacterized membrane protein YraQ (UPF0718 family)